MIGVNYRYELTPEKNMIKLAPTKGALLATTLLTAAAIVVPIFVVSFQEGWTSHQRANKIKNPPQN